MSKKNHTQILPLSFRPKMDVNNIENCLNCYINGFKKNFTNDSKMLHLYIIKTLMFLSTVIAAIDVPVTEQIGILPTYRDDSFLYIFLVWNALRFIYFGLKWPRLWFRTLLNFLRCEYKITDTILVPTLREKKITKKFTLASLWKFL
jgi:hypothetical protein